LFSFIIKLRVLHCMADSRFLCLFQGEGLSDNYKSLRLLAEEKSTEQLAVIAKNQALMVMCLN
jgi:hypothetical protein